MQNIHIHRYAESEYFQGVIHPEDRSWSLLIPNEGAPQLFIEVEASTEDGKIQKAYAPVEFTMIDETGARQWDESKAQRVAEGPEAPQ